MLQQKSKQQRSTLFSQNLKLPKSHFDHVAAIHTNIKQITILYTRTISISDNNWSHQGLFSKHYDKVDGFGFLLATTYIQIVFPQIQFCPL